ncbi:enoyl-CoA hydratase/isomerase family protein [Streptomyces sp. NPDC059740]|uniref:enoyl-CoA hydratase/isomerase family protein n=1 Tax=Streptomyces sp. NPDC059740 TaxID=3346926 RepID=UPI00364BE5BF
MEPALHTRVADGVATVVIRHPARRNAMTGAMWRSLPPLLDRLAADPAVRCLVLTGAGDTFCAGADITMLLDGKEDARALAVAAEEALAAFPKPTVAAVRGACVGGGCQLAVACDLRFAEHGALLGLTPARLGVVYPASATARLRSLVGPSTAKYLLFSGELVGADRALRMGLVDEVTGAGLLTERVDRFTAALAGGSLLTQMAAKEFTDREGTPAEREAHWASAAVGSGETAEGAAAFLGRRPPRFAWRPGASFPGAAPPPHEG